MLLGLPRCLPSVLMTLPAGLDPPSVKKRIQRDLIYYISSITSFVYMSRQQTSSKNCWVRRRMCLSSVSSRKFFFRASWLVLISFSSFSSFSKVAWRSHATDHRTSHWNSSLSENGLLMKFSDFSPPDRSCLWEKAPLDFLQCPRSGGWPS